MKRIGLLFALFAVTFNSFSQQGLGGAPKSVKHTVDFKNIWTANFAEPDVNQLRMEDAINDELQTGPWRFGYNQDVDFSFDNSGTWIDLPSGGKIWFLKVVCENALTVNLTFENLSIPEGNELYVYNPQKDFILGKFVENHLYDGHLGTELVPGNTAIIEYYIPPANIQTPCDLTLTTITHGYRTSGEYIEKAFGGSGSCNMNVNCPDGAPWTNERNSAVMLVSGSNGFCSGALINNTQNDGKPYVLTANHCYSNPATWIFRFNWQATACTNPTASPTFQSLSGGALRSRRTASDFCLVEITGGLVGGTVPSAYSPYFSGWDNSTTAPTSTVSIHHPSGDIKKISFDDASAVAATAMGSEANGVWQVEWDRNTTTEGGSSGSPLFNQDHRIIGQLWGGGASCSNLSAPDYYGRLSNSWNPSGSNNTNQLKFWLDPNNTGASFIDGFDPSGASSIAIDAGINNPLGVSGTLCTGTVSPQVTITNSGSDPLTSATISYGFDGNQNLTYNWTGNLSQWQTTTVTLPNANLAGGNHTFTAEVINPNGSADQNLTNNITTSSFTTVVNGQIAELNLNLDCYASETTWQLTNSTGNVLYSGTGYTDSNPVLVALDFCVDYGCYTFTINDSYGDGLTGCSAANGGAGSYQILYEGNVEAQITETQANFGSTNSQTFCLIDDTGIEETLLASALAVYPNPTTGILTVSNKIGQLGTVEVLNLQGQVVYTSQSDATIMTINLDALASGSYMLRVSNAQGIAVKQVVVE
jgi:hypothetical protein